MFRLQVTIRQTFQYIDTCYKKDPYPQKKAYAYDSFQEEHNQC